MSKSSILVDFYNLELSEVKGLSAPAEDRTKIIEFFEKHAPEAVKYKTADEIKKAFPEPKISINDIDFIGTLGHFEWRRGKSWFDIDVVNFYWWYKCTHQLVDLCLDSKRIPKVLLIWIASLTKDIRLEFNFKDSDGNILNATYSPDAINPKGYSFAETLFYISSDSSDSSKVTLGLGKFKFGLFREILAFLNEELQLRKCTADCTIVFIPMRSNQFYCSIKCRDREEKRRYRQRKKRLSGAS